MTLNGWLQIFFFLALILLVTKPLGVFMARVFNRERTFLDPVLGPIERLIYKLTRVDAEREMRWTEYAVAMLLFSVVSMLVLYLLQRFRVYCRSILSTFRASTLPGSRLVIQYCGFIYDEHELAVVRAEVTMSYLTQMAGLAYHNFSRQRWQCARDCVHSRHRTSRDAKRSEISGWT